MFVTEFRFSEVAQYHDKRINALNEKYQELYGRYERLLDHLGLIEVYIRPGIKFVPKPSQEKVK